MARGRPFLPLCAVVAATVLPAVAWAAPSTAPAQAVLSVPSGPGSLRGLASEAELDAVSGQVRHHIPIDTPAGVHGSGPGLALVYDGALGNGPLGVGWSLQLPAIRRSLAHGRPTFTDADPLEAVHLGGAGGPLLATGGGDYIVRGRGTRVRVRRCGAGLTLEDGGGQTLHFGAQHDSREGPAGRPSAWLLSDSDDGLGHRVRYLYRADGDDRLLSEVAWGPGEVFRVRLGYGDRPDPAVSYRPGYRSRQAQRLETLEVVSHGQILRTYHLGYGSSVGVSRLTEVRVVGRDGSLALPPMRMAYADAEAPTTFRQAGHRHRFAGSRGVILVDLEGRGMPDLVDTERHERLRNLGGHFAAPQGMGGGPWLSLGTTRFVDLDNDGRPEVVRWTGDGWQVWRWSPGGDGWSRGGIWPGTRGIDLDDERVHLTDVNGDGYPDVVSTTHGRLKVALGGAGGLAPLTQVADPGRIAARTDRHGDVVRVVDVNGDGLADVVALREYDYRVYLGRGDGTFEEMGHFPYPWGGRTLHPEDLHLVDLNRDGLTDLVRVARHHVTWYPGTTSGRFMCEGVTIRAPSADENKVFFGDLNGNGSVDLAWDNGEVVDLAGATHAGMLTEIDNGLGQVTRFDYESAAGLAARAEAAGRGWARSAHLALPVCTRITHKVAGSPPRVTALSVRDAVWSAAENRFTGFLRSQTTQLGDGPQASLTETARYHEGTGDELVLRGQVTEVTRHLGIVDGGGMGVGAGGAPSGPLLSRARRQLRALLPSDLAHLAAPAARVAALVQETTETFEGEPDAVVTRTRHAYDDLVRRVASHHDGRTDRAGDEATERWAYASSEAPWVRDVVVEHRLEDGDGQLVGHTRMRFDGDASGPLPLGQVARGLLRAEEGHLIDEGRWLRLSASDYDAHGNRVATTRGGQAWRLTYDDDGLYPLAESLELGDGQQLTWRAAWDRTTGLVRSLDSPAGGRQRAAYDALGRVTALAAGDDPPHTEYAYRWGGPVSVTETLLHDGDAGERRKQELFDGAGRPLSTAWRRPDGSWQVDARHAYNARGLAARSWSPFFAAAPDAAPPAGTAHQDFTYDGAARLLISRSSDGMTQRRRYSPGAERVEETALAPIVRHHDGLGRVTRVERLLAGGVEASEAEYDAAGRLIATRFAGGAAGATFVYDSLGRLVASDDSDAGTRALAWSDEGWLLSTHHQVGDEVGHTHDAAGRVVEQRAGDQVLRYHYDRGREPWQRHTAGHLAWAEDPAGEVLFSYTPEGRLEAVRRTILGESAHRRVTYTPSGLVAAVQDDEAPPLSHAYDSTGQLVSVGELWRCLTRLPGGACEEETFANGVVQRSVYDPLERAIGRWVLGPGGEEHLAELATRTPFGAVEAVTDLRARPDADGSAHYRYDDAARIVEATIGDFHLAYAHDPLQNLTARHIEGPRPLDMLAGEASFGPPGGRGPRQLRRLGGTHFHHDLAGRLTAAGPRRIAYDGFGHLAAVWRDQPVGPQEPTPDVDTIVPAIGAASALHASSGVVHYVYGFDGELAYSRGDAGVRRQFFADLEDIAGHRIRRVEAAGSTVARLPVGDVAHGARFIHPGLAAGTSLITDEHGQAIDTRRFTPCGVAITADFGLNARSADDKPRDPITGWSDHGARWVAPQFAQWLSADPASLAPSPDLISRPWDVHPYAFNRHNSQLYQDPDGRAVNIAMGVLGAGVGAAVGGGVEAARQLIVGDGFDVRAVAAASTLNAVHYGAAGLTMGASLLVQVPAAAAAGFAGTLAADAIAGSGASLSHAAVQGATSGLLAGATAFIPSFDNIRATMTTAVPKDLAAFAASKTNLSAVLINPNFYHSAVVKMATQYFSGLRQATPVGNGGTPDAVRYEALSGEQLHGKHHSKKCEELINRGQKLLNVHRDGLPSNRPRDRVKMSERDIRAVEHMVDELKSARSF